jgi:hypothetical protein
MRRSRLVISHAPDPAAGARRSRTDPILWAAGTCQRGKR